MSCTFCDTRWVDTSGLRGDIVAFDLDTDVFILESDMDGKTYLVARDVETDVRVWHSINYCPCCGKELR